jgi:protein O-mannosyl-transferase
VSIREDVRLKKYQMVVARTETVKVLLVCALLMAGTILAFRGVKDAGFVNYDDPEYVTENPVVQRGLTLENVKWAFTTFHFHNWHPLTWLSYMADCQLFGVNARAMHLMNLAFHVANTLLVFLLLLRLTGALGASGIVAAFFGWHPMHVESVAWIAERKDVLSTLFWLLTMCAYAEYAKRRPPSAVIEGDAKTNPARLLRRTGSRGWYAAMLALFTLGLMSKAMLVTLPFVLLLTDVWPLRRLDVSATGWWNNAQGLIIEKIPLLVLAAAASFAAYLAQAGSVIAVGDLTFAERAANACMSYARYIGKTIWPTDLAVFYPPGIWPVWQAVAVAIILGLVSVAAVKSVRDKPFFFTGWFWFLGTLVPVIGLVQVGSQSMADRYMYLPSIGLYLALVWTVREQLGPEPRTRTVALGATAAALIACLVLTVRQVAHWRNSVTLLTQAERVTPPNIVTLNNLAVALLKEGRTNEANQRVFKSLEVAPLEELTWRNAGSMAFREGRLEEALGYYRSGLKLRPQSPQLNFNAGVVLDGLGKPAEAIEHYRLAILVHPAYLQARMNLAQALIMTGDSPGAITNYVEIVRMHPDFAPAHSQLGKLYLDRGQTNQAVQHLKQALQLRPDDAEARRQLALALGKTENR